MPHVFREKNLTTFLRENSPGSWVAGILNKNSKFKER